MSDGSYELIEVKGDDTIDGTVVLAKAEAAREMAVASGVEYKMYADSVIMKTKILEAVGASYQATFPICFSVNSLSSAERIYRSRINY